MAGIRIKEKDPIAFADITEDTTFGVVDKDGVGVRTMLPAVVRQVAAGAVDEEVTGTTRTLTAADRGKLLIFTNAAGCALTIPDTLPDGFKVDVLQMDDDAVTFAGSGSITLAPLGEYETAPPQTQESGARVCIEIATAPGVGKIAKLSGELLRAADYAAQIGALGSAADSFSLGAFNSALSGATVDDAGQPRTPNAHAASHAKNGSDPLSTAAPISLAIGAAGNEGNANTYARSNHEHNFPSPPAPAAVARANATGDDTTVARSDHVHDGGVVVVTEFDDADSPVSLLSTHEIVSLDTSAGSIVITLPTAASVGARTWLLLQRSGDAAEDITLDPNGAEQINGVAANFILPGSDEDSVKGWLLVCDGSSWWVV